MAQQKTSIVMRLSRKPTDYFFATVRWMRKPDNQRNHL
jgi:hypothetical protein